MAVNKEKKVEILSKLKDIVKNSASIVLVNFHGLNIKDSTQMRRALREKGAGFLVAKKTLTKKALSEGGFSGEMPSMPGELGIAYSKDELTSAQGVYEFQKKLDKKISIVGGVFEGKFVGQSEMVSIAQIPGLQTLKAQFVNIINSPIQGFVMALSEIAKKKA
jgi:large subunit ribosomal protein L10